MKITALEVEGYGVWNGLKLDQLSAGLNVFYGPNEAGKTTLMQFLRSVFYGFSPERRRYLPPLCGGRPGGSVFVGGPNGRFQISRYDNEAEPGGPDLVSLAAPDGTRQGEHLLKVLLYDVDEKVFSNVFAIGLRELQELGTLSSTEAASLLYNLSVGLDRVSLVEVMRELAASRNRILDAGGGPCQVSQLLAERERLRVEVENSGSLSRRYARLAADQDQLQREIARIEEDGNQLQQEVRVLEIAAGLRERWQRRAALRAELAALEPAGAVPEGIVEQLDAARAQIEIRQRRLEQWKQDWAQLRDEASGLKINEALQRLAPRIEGLQEQENWIGTLENRIAELELEIGELEAQSDARRKRFGLIGSDGTSLPSLSPHSLAALREPARAVHRCQSRVHEAEQEVVAGRETAESLAAQIKARVEARGEADLPEALDRSGNLVAQLRRRVQIEERLGKMEQYRADLDEQTRFLLDRQLMPLRWVFALGAVFVVGVILAMAGLFMPKSITGTLGWPMAILGLGGTAAAVVMRIVLERSNARQLEACQKQMNMLQLQIKQAKEERGGLEKQLPAGSGPIASRLKTAEEELAGLEELAPLDAKRKASQQEAEAAAQRVAQAQSEFETARRRWREAVSAAGLPKDLTPKQVRELAGSREQIGETQRALDVRREELDQRRRELGGLTGRIAQIVADTGLAVVATKPVEQLQELVREVSEQEDRLKRREALRKQVRKLRHKKARLEAAVGRRKRRRRELLRRAGVNDEEQLRQRADQYARTASLRREFEAVQGEINAAIAGHCPEEVVRQQIEEVATDTLQTRRGQLEKRLQAVNGQLQERFEKRGRLSEQLKTLVEDRSAVAKQLESGVVEKRLEEAVHRWQVVAVTGRILDGIRKTYERERQPETLKEASGYLGRLTQGRYPRVWTPFGEETLLVDNAQGKSLPVEALSQGGREQLFLCLRLALANSYARRGAPLPMILDDVLVNFDEQRAKAAVGVLRDFADSGHQLLVFTCHAHLARLFSSLRVDVKRLPNYADGEAAVEVSLPAPKRRRRRGDHPRELPHRVVAESADKEPIEESPDTGHEDSQEKKPVKLERQAPWQEDETDGLDGPLEDDGGDSGDEEQPSEDADDAEHDYAEDQISEDDAGDAEAA